MERIFISVMDADGRIICGMVTDDRERANKYVRHQNKAGRLAIIQKRK